jgi:hypothetical protein
VDADGYQPITVRFAGSLKGRNAGYEVSVFDAKGHQSWPPLRQYVTLE